MKKIIIEIKTTNDAFEGYMEQELSRILYNLTERIEEGRRPRKLMDINGNTVGKVEYK